MLVKKAILKKASAKKATFPRGLFCTLEKSPDPSGLFDTQENTQVLKQVVRGLPVYTRRIMRLMSLFLNNEVHTVDAIADYKTITKYSIKL